MGEEGENEREKGWRVEEGRCKGGGREGRRWGKEMRSCDRDFLGLARVMHSDGIRLKIRVNTFNHRTTEPSCCGPQLEIHNMCAVMLNCSKNISHLRTDWWSVMH